MGTKVRTFKKLQEIAHEYAIDVVKCSPGYRFEALDLEGEIVAYSEFHKRLDDVDISVWISEASGVRDLADKRIAERTEGKALAQAKVATSFNCVIVKGVDDKSRITIDFSPAGFPKLNYGHRTMRNASVFWSCRRTGATVRGHVVNGTMAVIGEVLGGLENV